MTLAEIQDRLDQIENLAKEHENNLDDLEGEQLSIIAEIADMEDRIATLENERGELLLDVDRMLKENQKLYGKVP